ncbi:MAG TPA: GNAT family N-acetyltransferase [Bacteroidia bacterium]|jgi:predicted GNAT family acetyltransferase|nr:GNAT family N-acetyltransferase [Bacteroidia bacterium]
MAKSNFERMLALAEETFDARNDPQQLDVNEKVLEQLRALHPATLGEYDDGKGPVVWILLIPTTEKLMKEFLENKIGEKQLLENTPAKEKFTAIYLCSAMVLEEYRGKGIAKKLTLKAIEEIRTQHPVQNLFVWPFSKEGEVLAKSIAKITGLLLKVKTH